LEGQHESKWHVKATIRMSISGKKRKEAVIVLSWFSVNWRIPIFI